MAPLSFLKKMSDIIPPLPAVATAKARAIFQTSTSKRRIAIAAIPRNRPSENVMTKVKDIFCALFMTFILSKYPYDRRM
jgi:hypothetical protein